MRVARTTVAFAALVAVTLVAASADAKGPPADKGGAKGRPSRGRSELVRVDPAVDLDARGRIDVRHFGALRRRAERSWLRVRTGRLDGTDYTLWMDDPSTPETDLVEVKAFTANEDGAAHFRFDTKRGDTLPFGATLAALAGMAVEVRDGSGVAILTSTMPAPGR